MEKAQPHPLRRATTRVTVVRALAATILFSLAAITSLGITTQRISTHTTVPINAAQIVQHCQALNVLPSPPKDFHLRSESDRYVPGTPPTLIRNATIWTGRASGHEVVFGDILLDKGVIREIGFVGACVLESYENVTVLDAGGAWVTPGYVIDFLLAFIVFNMHP